MRRLDLAPSTERLVTGLQQALLARGHEAANILRNAELEVLRGQRHGRTYRVPGTRALYTASAAGESPAVRTGGLRADWSPQVRVQSGGGVYRVTASIVSTRPYLPFLDPGGGRIAQRPIRSPILQKAQPELARLAHAPLVPR